MVLKPQKTNFIDQLVFNENGLIPAIAQDWLDGSVLMMAWMNKVSLQETISSGQAYYWSRSRKEIWHKGATSGHKQIIKDIFYDCDKDAILLKVLQVGDIACHKGTRSCFSSKIDKDPEKGTNDHLTCLDACSEVFSVISQREAYPEKDSYTNKLLDGGTNAILKKIGEESAEFVMACKDNEKESIANEAADLIFHLQVALKKHSVDWREVLKVLKERRNAPRRN
tara:strand:- start:1450 stop:2124 length:675 start_codon:yes stop_codon:yes gene_type:complete